MARTSPFSGSARGLALAASARASIEVMSWDGFIVLALMLDCCCGACGGPVCLDDDGGGKGDSYTSAGAFHYKL